MFDELLGVPTPQSLTLSMTQVGGVVGGDVWAARPGPSRSSLCLGKMWPLLLVPSLAEAK